MEQGRARLLLYNDVVHKHVGIKLTTLIRSQIFPSKMIVVHWKNTARVMVGHAINYSKVS